MLLGYSMSSIVRPFIAITTTWTQVFTVRVLDRVGKGVRGAPRDAMLATWTTPTTRGKVYGFHRAMDHRRRGDRAGGSRRSFCGSILDTTARCSR